jgi:hypothetical protein
MSDWQQEGGEEGGQQESTPETLETPQEGGQQEGGQPAQEGGGWDQPESGEGEETA